MKPFDYIKNICDKGENLMRGYDSDSNMADYNPWIMNKFFSTSIDTILIANFLNTNYHLDNKMQYEFYKYTVRSKRYPSLIKRKDSEYLGYVCDYYSCNKEVGKTYISLLSEEQLEAIKKEYNKGG